MYVYIYIFDGQTAPEALGPSGRAWPPASPAAPAATGALVPEPRCVAAGARTCIAYLKGPCTCIITTWALQGLLYHDFGAYICKYYSGTWILWVRESNSSAKSAFIYGCWDLTP